MHALNEDMVALQNAMGEKNGTMLHYLSNFVSGVAVGKLGSASAGPTAAPFRMRLNRIHAAIRVQLCVDHGYIGQGNNCMCRSRGEHLQEALACLPGGLSCSRMPHSSCCTMLVGSSCCMAIVPARKKAVLHTLYLGTWIPAMLPKWTILMAVIAQQLDPPVSSGTCLAGTCRQVADVRILILEPIHPSSWLPCQLLLCPLMLCVPASSWCAARIDQRRPGSHAPCATP